MTDSKAFSDKLVYTIKKHTNHMDPFPTELEKQIKPLPGIKAVFFDVYGTMLISGTGDIGISEKKNNDYPISEILIDSSFNLLSSPETINKIFSNLLSELIKEEHMIMKKSGFDFPEIDIIEIWNEILAILIEKNYISGVLNRDKVKIAALTYECMVNPVWPMKNIDKVLDHLYNSDLKIGIISNAQFYTSEILQVLLNFKIGNDFFDPRLLFYSYREKLAKPSKDFFLKAVTKIKTLYNIDSDEILYIGNDMLNDVYTASQCRCRTALFAGDKRSLRLRLSDSRCRDLKPDIIITELEQLIDIL